MASREQNDAVAGLLRQSLAKDTPGQVCPDPELLAAYFEHSLAEDEVSRFDLHLSKCTRCRAQVAAMVRAEPPKLQAKTFWLLDWRLLAATALILVIATIWFLRRPSQLASVAQNVSAPVMTPIQPPKAESSNTQAARAPLANESPITPAEKIKKAAAGLRPAPPEAKRTVPPSEGKLGRDKSRSVAVPADHSPARATSNSRSLQTKSADFAPPQPPAVASGQSYGATAKQETASAAATPQPMPPAAQTVLVEPRLQAPPKANSSQAARSAAKESDGASAGVAGGREPVDVSSTAQSQTVTNAQKATDKLVTADAANETAVQVQALEERNREQVIPTPIPAIKWRITSAGFVERSEDGGATWTGQEPDPEAHLIAGSAPTDKVCWLVGKEGVVLVTKDATNWKKIPPPANTDITAVSAKNASDATVTTSDGRRFSTHDEGKRWKPVKEN